MPKEEDKKEPNCVSISDWISILQGKTSESLTLLIFTATIFFAIIVGVPPSLTGTVTPIGLVWFSTALILIVIIFIFLLIHQILQRRNEPYKDLLKDILYGKITDATKIREKYFEIEERNNK